MKNPFNGLKLRDLRTAHKIAARAKALNPELDQIDVALDLMETHLNGCPLRLDDLLAADDFNLMHDVYGISAHLNRETGQIEDCFLPRFHGALDARKEAA